MKEEWKTIVESNGYYEVSSHGRVRRVNGDYNSTYSGRILAPTTTPKGYQAISLSINGKRITRLAHRLVAEAFIANPENKPQVNHKDGIKANNYDWNLEWATCQENILHARRILKVGLFVGEESPGAILRTADVKKIKEMLRDGILSSVVAEKFNTSRSNIHYIKKGTTWSHVTV